MKIIENNYQEAKSWKIVCGKCNSVLEYTKEDVISKETHFFYLHYFKCPCCGASVDVKHWYIMANIIPVLIALQAHYTSRKSSCLDRCRRCQYYKGQFEKCKGDKTPEYDWKYCPENDW